MSLDKKLLDDLVEQKTMISEVIIGDKKFQVVSSELGYSDVPVNKPTTRGGVYFSDTRAFRAKLVIADKSVSNVLPKAMLGPNTEFAKIHLIPQNNSAQIFANLTNYVQKSSGFELNLVVIECLAK